MSEEFRRLMQVPGASDSGDYAVAPSEPQDPSAREPEPFQRREPVNILHLLDCQGFRPTGRCE